MVYVHITHRHDRRKATPRERAVALFVVALCVLAFAIIAVLAGPKVGSPPPPIVLWGLVALFVGTALLAFFTWLKWQGEGDAPTQHTDPGEEK
ncbi:MAG: hypothetical protein ACYC3L_06820 [Gemmatimonadaceae bacterium]